MSRDSRVHVHSLETITGLITGPLSLAVLKKSSSVEKWKKAMAYVHRVVLYILCFAMKFPSDNFLINSRSWNTDEGGLTLYYGCCTRNAIGR